MDEYNIQLTQNRKMVFAMLLPLLLWVPFVWGMIYLAGNDTPDSVIVPLIIVFMLLFFGATWFTVRVFRFSGVLQLKNNGFAIRFTKRHLLTPKDFDLRIEDVTNFWTDESQGYRYMSFNASINPSAFNVAPGSGSAADVAAFGELMVQVSQMVAAHNQSVGPQETPAIRSRTMYQTWWAKLLAATILLVMVGGPLLYFLVPDKSPTASFFVAIIFGIPFLYKVWYYNFGKGSGN